MIPEGIISEIESQVGASIQSSSKLFGGDINKAAKLTFDNGSEYFIKWNPSAPEGMFTTESKGLELLRSVKTDLVIPNTILVGRHFLLMSFLEEKPGMVKSSFDFGSELAKLHKNSSPRFGLEYHNYIGKLTQQNTHHSSWPEFFVAERIEPLLKKGVDSFKMDSKFASVIPELFNAAEYHFPDEPPSLIHGDLWSGNYMFVSDGKTSIYDPAVYYGHREMDIAMTRLFGGFEAQFYEGYESEYPLEKGFEERITLYSLYPILVHAVLFGGGYWQNASNIIEKYTS